MNVHPESAREIMTVETNLTRIKKLAHIRHDENWDFRTFLKLNDSDGRVDRLVKNFYQEVASAIDCKACGNCCREVMAVLDQEDIETFARGLGMSPADLTAKYIVNQEDGPAFQTPCPFLEGNLCSNYESRPKGCQSYPHLHQERFTGRLISVVLNYETCPIVFNVYERLKEELWTRRHHNRFSHRKRSKDRR